MDTVAALRTTEWQKIISKTSQFNEIIGQQIIDDFYQTIQTAMDYHQPLKQVTIRDDEKQMTVEIKRGIQERQARFKEGKGKAWEDQCTVVKKQIKKRKRQYNRRLTSNSKSTWSAIKQLRKPTVPSSNNEALATMLNEGFYKV